MQWGVDSRFEDQNPNNFQNPNQFSNQHPQNIPNFGFAPNFNQSSSVPNFHPYCGSMMRNLSQTLPFNGYMPMVNENVPSGGAPEFPEFSTQITIANEDSTPKSKKTPQPSWNTEQNLVLIRGWIKFGTSSVVGRNQKGETYWGQIADYCNEHCSFDPPRDGVACRNRFNYMNKILGKWIDAYDGAKRFQGSGWSENDVLAKDLVLVLWVGRQLKKRVKKSKETSEVVEKEWTEFKQLREKELEQMEKMTLMQQEANKVEKMKLYLQLSSDDRKKKMLEKLAQELFDD
ncbi:uncharacterized protein LOC123904982 [Trifolium pratense]|uniref:uncharacterized protein LOC123904961 n=1 Tax=Trifolium pratense TaxID=57577 RepID=UPI001E696646|nr:uncharacterized protein LOC123904961 [Trifolium pratense]XP_045810540.1 uncharacterized protein LOC123904982 [Trifolium pratense]